jgi:hypothetical protein
MTLTGTIPSGQRPTDGYAGRRQSSLAKHLNAPGDNPMQTAQNSGKVIGYLFSIVFCLIGMGVLYGAAVNFEEGDMTTAVLMLVAALAFGGFGFAVYILLRTGFQRQNREATLQSSSPDEPWKWRDDWLVGRVRSMEKGSAGFWWGFAILWNLISTPLLFFLPEEILEKGNYGALFGLLFPLVGVGLVVAAIRKTIQGRKYGNCVFAMQHVPGVLGGEVAGTVIVPRGLPPGETLSMRLSCVQQIQRRSGKDTRTDENVLWQTEQPSISLSPTGDAASQSAPVRFRIPYDSSPTARIDDATRVFWKLEANAAVPGVDFSTAFEIPVFKTATSSPQNTEEELRSEEMRDEAPVSAPVGQTIVTVGPSAGGGTEFVLHPNKGVPGTLPSLVAMFVFAVIAVLLAYAGAPFLFPLVFGGIALLIIFLIVFGAYGESRIVVEDGHVSVRNTLFGIMRGRRMPCSSITKISVSGQGKAGKRGYYSISLLRNDGKTFSPLQGLSDRREADWLADEVRKAMGPWRTQDQRDTFSPR